MPDLFDLDRDEQIAFLRVLSNHGVAAAVARACIDDPDGVGARRTEGFMNPPPVAATIEVAPSEEPPEPMWRPVEGNPNAIDVNLAHDPKLPFTGARVDWRLGKQTGWVRLEKKDGELYRDGRKVNPHLEPEQTPGKSLQGHELFDRLKAKMAGVVLHSNEKTALMANPHLFPESWKVDAEGRTLHTYFWAVGFRSGQSNRYVECVCFNDGAWREYCKYLDNYWSVNYPAAHAS